MMKRIVSLLLLTALVLSLVPFSAAAEGNATLQQLQEKFPEGKYWNHLVKEGHGYGGEHGTIHFGANCGDVENTCTDHPCTTHRANAGVGGYDCNCYNGSLQCRGFALKLANMAYGGSCLDWQKHSRAEALTMAKPGDVIHYNYYIDKERTKISDYGHWVFVIGGSGANITVGECNADNHCGISWTRNINLNEIIPLDFTLYSAPSVLSTSPIPVMGINTAGKTVLKVGETVHWTASALPENATDKSLYWNAGNKGVATVDQNGNITAHKVGKCNISITAKNGFQKVICVTVGEIQTAGKTVLKVGETVTWRAAPMPVGFYKGRLFWAAGNPGVATVDQNGNITAHRAGQCNITVSAGYSADCVKKTVLVTVTGGNVPVTGIATAGKTKLTVGEKVKWTASVLPANATEKSLWWGAGNPGVATVDQNGNITAHKPGQCNITITAKNGVKKTILVTVVADYCSAYLLLIQPNRRNGEEIEKVAIADISGDGIPELMFVRKEKSGENLMIHKLHIYSMVGDAAKEVFNRVVNVDAQYAKDYVLFESADGVILYVDEGFEGDLDDRFGYYDDSESSWILLQVKADGTCAQNVYRFRCSYARDDESQFNLRYDNNGKSITSEAYTSGVEKLKNSCGKRLLSNVRYNVVEGVRNDSVANTREMKYTKAVETLWHDSRNEVLKTALKKNGLMSYLLFFPEDYDGDGNKEAFVFTGKFDDASKLYEGRIYYVNHLGECSLAVREVAGNPYHEILGTQDSILKAGNRKFFQWISHANGSGSSAILLSCKNGKVFEPQINWNYHYVYKNDNGKYYGVTSDYSSGYHQYPQIPLLYDNATGEFTVDKNSPVIWPKYN